MDRRGRRNRRAVSAAAAAAAAAAADGGEASAVASPRSGIASAAAGAFRVLPPVGTSAACLQQPEGGRQWVGRRLGARKSEAAGQ